MAIVQTKLDDLDGTVLELDHPATTFALEGTQYSVDLSEANAAALRKTLERFISISRIVEQVPPMQTRLSPVRKSDPVPHYVVGDTKMDANTLVRKVAPGTNPLADGRGNGSWVSVGKQLIVDEAPNAAIKCFLCDTELVKTAKKATNGSFKIIYLDRNHENVTRPNVVPVCHRCCVSWNKMTNPVVKASYQNMIDLYVAEYNRKHA